MEYQRGTAEIPNRSPEWLSSEAKTVWLRCAASLFATPVLESTDKVFFALFCDTYAELQKARWAMVGGPTQEARAEAEKHIAVRELLLAALLIEMGFDSESEFEQCLQNEIQ